MGIDLGHGDHVKGRVPGGVPGILPLVGHGDHVAIEQVAPVRVAPLPAACGRRRLAGIAFEPVLDHVVVELLRPEQAGVRLPADAAVVVRRAGRDAAPIELVGLAGPVRKHAVEVRAEGLARGLFLGEEPQVDGCRILRGDVQHVVRRGFRAGRRGIDRVRPPADDVLVKRVLDVRAFVGGLEEPLVVRLVVGEQQRAARGRRDPDRHESGTAPRSGARKAPRLRPPAAIRASACSLRAGSPRTRCCETRGSAAGEASAASGPRLAAVIRIRMSFGDDLAYSAKTSK